MYPSLASTARGISLSRLSTCTQTGASFDAEEPYYSRARELTICMPLETWVVLRDGSKNTKQCGIGP
jgi:hypothetical protein